MHDAIFESFSSLQDLDIEDDEAAAAAVIEIGAGIGLDEEALAECVNSQRYRPIIGALASQALDQGVNVTPYLLITGPENYTEAVPGFLEYPDFAEAVEKQYWRALGTPIPTETPLPTATPEPEAEGEDEEGEGEGSDGDGETSEGGERVRGWAYVPSAVAGGVRRRERGRRRSVDRNVSVRCGAGHSTPFRRARRSPAPRLHGRLRSRARVPGRLRLRWAGGAPSGLGRRPAAGRRGDAGWKDGADGALRRGRAAASADVP